MSHPLRGLIFENLVIIEIMKMYYNSWYQPELYFYRDHHQHEVDLLLKKVDQYILLEIKSSQTFHPEFFKALNYLSALAPDKFQQAYLVYAGVSQRINNFKLLNIFDVYNEFEQSI